MSTLTVPAGPSRLRPGAMVAAFSAVAIAILISVVLGPAGVDPWGAVKEAIDHLPLIEIDSGLTEREAAIVWQIRMPRLVLAGLVGATLAGAGAAYQGVFRNPLADPYLLGVAAGAGLGATFAIVSSLPSGAIPPLAFVGGIAAVVTAYSMARLAGRGGSSLILAGVATATFFTAVQTYVQQLDSDTIREVFSWILGRLATSGWSEVWLLLPYALVSSVTLLAYRRHLDVMAVGEEEAATLGIDPGRVRSVVVIAATLGSAAAVAVSGLIGFVGIIVPHMVRLTFGVSNRLVLPISLIWGAAFLMVADVVARTARGGGEIPIGVITAFIGAPFFALILARQGQSG